VVVVVAGSDVVVVLAVVVVLDAVVDVGSDVVVVVPGSPSGGGTVHAAATKASTTAATRARRRRPPPRDRFPSTAADRSPGRGPAIRACYREALELWSDTGDRRGMFHAIEGIAITLARAGRFVPAAQLFAGEELSAQWAAGQRRELDVLVKEALMASTEAGAPRC
jgi:hypothetical protein